MAPAGNNPLLHWQLDHLFVLYMCIVMIIPVLTIHNGVHMITAIAWSLMDSKRAMTPDCMLVCLYCTTIRWCQGVSADRSLL